MLNSILVTKQKQTQMFQSDGKRIPVTEMLAVPCIVTQIKTVDHDGYWGLQLGFGQRKNITKPLSGHLKKSGPTKPRFLREIRLNVDPNQQLPFKLGDQIFADTIFKVGDKVSVTGISKSKGFQGGVKRHGFAGGPRTHGQSDRERAPGSIGQTTTPGRVYKGKRMAGRTGGGQITINGLEVVEINRENNLLKIKGLVPGSVNNLLLISKIN